MRLLQRMLCGKGNSEIFSEDLPNRRETEMKGRKSKSFAKEIILALLVLFAAVFFLFVGIGFWRGEELSEVLGWYAVFGFSIVLLVSLGYLLELIQRRIEIIGARWQIPSKEEVINFMMGQNGKLLNNLQRAIMLAGIVVLVFVCFLFPLRSRRRVDSPRLLAESIVIVAITSGLILLAANGRSRKDFFHNSRRLIDKGQEPISPRDLGAAMVIFVLGDEEKDRAFLQSLGDDYLELLEKEYGLGQVRILNELSFLSAFAVDHTVRNNIHGSKSTAVLIGFYDSLRRNIEVNGMPYHKFESELHSRYSEYQKCTGKSHPSAVPLSIGKAFARICGNELDSALIAPASMAFRLNIGATKDLIDSHQVANG